MTHTYQITGMTCSGCISKVKSELLKLGDVHSAEVQLGAPQATITMQQHIPLTRLQEAVNKAGKYSITEADNGMQHNKAGDTETTASYYPIFLIFGYITVVTLLLQFASESFDWMEWANHFMSGFFLVFSFFKLMNLKGFAEGYRTYDVVAKHLPVYGFVYPFIELALGIAFLIGIAPLATNIITLVVMSVSTIGVVQSLLRKSHFQCACLGTVIQLPLSKVTLFEDLLMVAMSAVMIGNLIA